MRALRCLALLLVIGASPALAQSEPAVEKAGFPLERLRPALDRDGIIDVESGSVGSHLSYDAALWLSYARNPLTLSRRLPDGSRERAGVLLENRLGSSLVAAVSFLNWVQLGAELPMILYQGRGPEQATAGALLPELSAVGVGDLRLVPKVRILRREDQLVDLAVVGAITVPTGFPADSYMGEGFFTFSPELVASTRLAGVKVGANAGMRFRPETRFADLKVSHELLYRAGVGYDFRDVVGLPFDIGASVAGATAITEPFQNLNQNPMEALFGGAVDVWGPLQVFGGGGVGLVAGFGTPDFRVFGGGGVGLVAGFGTPDFRVFAGLRFGQRSADRDGDGIPDAHDACPDEPEDRDGFEDLDGCPDPDNDRDGIFDVDDRCPDVPGVPERQGCPADDGDGDGILDGDDACPEDPEDFDGFEDEDGCPDLDNDEDGIPDVDDECPDDPEDFDGFEDEDGCPDRDNDEDEITDEEDMCPDVPGVPEKDGCPLETTVLVTKSRIEISETVYFETDSAAIKPESFSILREVAKAIQATPAGTRVRVEGHTDSVGVPVYNLDLSQRRAESVRRFLVKEGLPSESLDAEGFGDTKPIATNDTPKGRQKNRRVVFTLLVDDP